MKFIKLSKENLLFEKGHTLSFIKKSNLFYAYKGYADFSQIDLYIGKSLRKLKFKKTILENKRWAVVLKDKNKVHLFCTSRTDQGSDTFKYQNIHWYESNDGVDFKENQIITTGSAPWIWKHKKQYYLYYHRKTDTNHDILLRKSDSISSLATAEEKIILSILITANQPAMSGPSIAEINKSYYLTVEYHKDPSLPWETQLYIADNLEGPFTFVKRLLYNARACTFQYILGKKYMIIYSAKKNNIWGLYYKTGKIK